jgi:UDP-2,3-diacylglucosamine pyrophosphatase LpxH
VHAFAAAADHTVVVLSGNHDGNIAWDPHLTEVLGERLGVTHFALSADLVLATGAGDQRVHVVHGNQDDPYNAFVDPRSPIDTPTGHHVVRQVLPQFDRTVRPGGLLDGLTWLSEPTQAGEMVGSRLLYRSLVGRAWWLAIPFVAAFGLRLVTFLPGVEALLDAHAVGWLYGLGLAMIGLVLLVAGVALVTMLGVHRALSNTEIGDRSGIGAHNAATRERAARMVELGYTGLIAGHTHSPELSVVGSGFYANSGCGVEVLGPRQARFGLPRPFTSVRRCARVELRAGDEVEVQLVLADTPLPVDSALERFVMKPDRAS